MKDLLCLCQASGPPASNDEAPLKWSGGTFIVLFLSVGNIHHSSIYHFHCRYNSHLWHTVSTFLICSLGSRNISAPSRAGILSLLQHYFANVIWGTTFEVVALEYISLKNMFQIPNFTTIWLKTLGKWPRRPLTIHFKATNVSCASYLDILYSRSSMQGSTLSTLNGSLDRHWTQMPVEGRMKLMTKGNAWLQERDSFDCGWIVVTVVIPLLSIVSDTWDIGVSHVAH
jgi:hypothetical protein